MAGEWVLLHGGALGDLVLSIQFALRLMPPGRCERLSVLSRTDPGDLLGCTPAIVRRSLEGLSSHWLYATGAGSPPERLCDELRGRRVINALEDESGPVQRRLKDCGVSAVFSLDPRPRGGPGHITTQWQRDLERQGLLFPKCVYSGRYVTSITPDAGLVRGGREYLRDAGVTAESILLIHPGSGGREKCWPLGKFVDLARRLAAENRAFAFVVGPVERERWAASVLDSVRTEFPTCEPANSGELAAVLSAGSVLISNDSGPAHLAALLGCRTLTLFGPTRAETWRPLSRRGIAIQGRSDAGDDWGLDVEAVSEIVIKCTESGG